jgi:hypothetical protein
MPHLLPVLRHAFTRLGVASERDASRVAPRPLALAGAPDGVLDGPERRRQRPTDAAPPTEQDSGTKTTQTDKHLLLVHEPTPTGGSFGPPIAGKTPAKKAAEAAQSGSPTNATLGTDTGLPGDEPAGRLPRQPKKNRQARRGAWRPGASIISSPAPVWVSQT